MPKVRKYMLFIGITGGVGAGKSEILNFLRTNYNSKVMLTDEIAHDLMEPGTDCYSKLKELFAPSMDSQSIREKSPVTASVGVNVYNEDGTFNRPNLAKVIFSDEAKRDALNAIVHPAVKQYVVDQYQYELEKTTCAEEMNLPEEKTNLLEERMDLPEERMDVPLDLLVVESALLIDDHYGDICEEMWYIYTSEENRRARLKASRGYSDEKIQSIFDSQLSEEEFRRHCVEVIDNNGTTEESFAQIRAILERKGICAR